MTTTKTLGQVAFEAAADFMEFDAADWNTAPAAERTDWEGLALAVVAAAPSKPAWTTDPPTKPGWYWWRPMNGKPVMVEVHDQSYSGDLFAIEHRYDDSESWRLSNFVEQREGEWCPVQEPPP